MKAFGKIALLFGLLGGLMAYLIIPLHFSRKRSYRQLIRPSTL